MIPPTTKGIPTQTWAKDTIHSINLEKYFQDPDGDALTYSATSTNNIQIEIIGNTAHLTPTRGWTGEEKTTFIADDQKGGKINSNTVTLKVQKQILPNYLAKYLSATLILIAIILLIISMYINKKK